LKVHHTIKKSTQAPAWNVEQTWNNRPSSNFYSSAAQEL